MNVIVIISDTLRRDHLPCYGITVVSAPNLDKFSRTAFVFDNCYAASFPTVPARADILTGRFTFPYLPWGALPADEVTLAQSLSRAGYLTTAISDNPFLIRNGYGYDRGFADILWIRGQRTGAELDDVLMQRRSELDRFAPMTFKNASEWLERHHRDKFFLYIDTWDPHEPWDPPDYYVRPYCPDYNGEIVNPPYWDWREAGYTEKQLEIAHACYCGEITMVDRWFGILMERLQTLDLLSNTEILFASDHGFYFGEHGQFGKRRFRWADNLTIEDGFKKGRALAEGFTYRSPLHQELTRVPLMIYLPGGKGGRLTGLVSLPDLFPTILDLVNVPLPEPVEARSLAPMLVEGAKVGHDFVVTSAPFDAVGDLSKTVDDKGRETIEISPSTITDGTWDLLYAVHGAEIELYRTVEDPGHMKNVFGENRGIAEALHRKFVAWLEKRGTANKFLDPRREL
jgi:arylsulfatase A-like enzyme